MCNCWWCPDNVKWVDQVLFELACDSEDSNTLGGELHNLACSLKRDNEQCDCFMKIVILWDPIDSTFFTTINGEVAEPEAGTLEELRVILNRDYPEAELRLDFDE